MGHLVHIGDQFVGNNLTVFLPVFAILSLTTEMVTTDSLKKQNSHVDNIEVREEVSRSTGHAHGQRDEKITNIVEVTRQSFFLGGKLLLFLKILLIIAKLTPETRSKKQGLVQLSIRGRILGTNETSGLTPNLALAIGGSDNVLLMVHGTENVVPGHTNNKDQGKVRPAEVKRMTNQKVGLNGVLFLKASQRVEPFFWNPESYHPG